MSLGFTALLLARHALLIVIPTIPTASAAATSVCTDKGYPIACAAPSSNATVCLATGECPKECPGLRVEDVHEDKCVDRRIFDEWRKYDIPALFIWFISSGLAVSAGVGGGGIFVPLGILLLRFSTKASTGLSQASIFGASLAGFILNSRARHPKAPRPLIDFDMALFLAPMEMAGALLGALIQMILPTWLVIIIMSLVLGLTSAKTFARGIRVYREERQSRAFPTREDGPEVNTPNGSQPCDGDGKAEGFRNEHGVASAQECDEGPLPSLVLPPDDAASDSAVVREQWKDRDARQYPLEKYWKLAMVWATIILLLLLRGGKGTESVIPDAVPYCGWAYWTLSAVVMAWLILFGLCMGRSAVMDSAAKATVDYPFVSGDVIWTYPSFIFYSLATFAAGIMAGLLGIGGGMVSTATTATLIVFTSSSAALVFIMAGLVPWDYAVVYFSAAFVGTLVGKTIIDTIVRRRGLTALLIFLLAGIIAFAAIMVTVAGLIK
ncbi:hypothetical protein FOZ61_007926 [Perkinsus olseni]|uniref:Sulfite exporter TauE/SafE n=1 Tax=Perkinsus olseni TaxID=32597 RepID=A0A7J6MHL0_PEROL|nr:hypothetical protein FOZ61_007926 [Perkinsus olseni]